MLRDLNDLDWELANGKEWTLFQKVREDFIGKVIDQLVFGIKEDSFYQQEGMVIWIIPHLVDQELSHALLICEEEI